MKTSIQVLIVIISLLFVQDLFAQRKVIVVNRHHPHHDRVVVIKHHPHYQPRRVVVYRPMWSPHRSFNRRWVFFPRYNFYWDNYRQVYVYPYQGNWISQSNTPVFIGNANLAQERHYELSEANDSLDDIHTYNHQHRNNYKY